MVQVALAPCSPFSVSRDLMRETAALAWGIAARIGGMIDNGTYRVGERVPSIRELSRQLRVSANTVMEAYANLENIGRIEARRRIADNIEKVLKGEVRLRALMEKRRGPPPAR